ETGGQIFLEKRTAKDIWKNLFQLPLVETQEDVAPEEILKNKGSVFLKGCNAEIKHISAQKKHVLSHQIIYARLIHLMLEDAGCIKGNYLLVDKKDISKFAVPRLIEHFLYDYKIY
ncbi:MAG TPA: NUDIX domain-containing protein, partial [Prolixibacteraceae bacterium]|nr:NUDIX domain-containing protein [Prolixibacteraceae bacterium]